MRTEEQKITQGPVQIRLGGELYEVKPLPIKFASPWRKKFIALMENTSILAKVTSDDTEKYMDALKKILLDEPDRLVDLFFEYARDLNRDEIENLASSAEILKGLEEVIALESPFLGAAIRVTKAMQRNLV